MKYQQWSIPELPAGAVDRLTGAGYPYLVSSVLASRGITTPEEAAAFLERDRDLPYSPFLMKDMDKAAQRVSRALADGEKIAVFGDYDVDGITATVILVDYLLSRGGDVVHYIPRRIEDGYGLGRDAILSLHGQGVRLLVTVDCGITGVEEVAYANSLGMDVVVTDHHECKEELPPACAVVDPHRPDCGYPFKHLAGCGVALKLVLALGGESREEALLSRYCTLAAIGTVADVMQMSDENRTIVSRGLASISRSDFIGLHALLHEAGLSDKTVTSVQIGFVLAPRINAAGRMGAADMAADLLLCTDPHRAEHLARELCAEPGAPGRGAGDLLPGRGTDRGDPAPGAQRPGAGLRHLAPGGGRHRGLPPFGKIRLSQLYDPPVRRHRQGLLPQLGRVQSVRRAGVLLRPAAGLRRP